MSDNAKSFESTAKLLRQLYNNDDVATFIDLSYLIVDTLNAK